MIMSNITVGKQVFLYLLLATTAFAVIKTNFLQWCLFLNISVALLPRFLKIEILNPHILLFIMRHAYYLFAKYVDSCYKTISFLVVFLLESYFHDFNWLIQQGDVLQTHICKGWITASGLEIVNHFNRRKMVGCMLKLCGFILYIFWGKNEQMMTLIQEEYFVGKHFDLWPGYWFVPLCFTSDYLQGIPMNRYSKPIQMGKNVINILEHLVVMAVELSSMTQFCVMFLESILKSAYQDQTSEAGMFVSIADGLYSTPHFPRYKAGFQPLPHLLFNTTSANWAPISFFKVMSS